MAKLHFEKPVGPGQEPETCMHTYIRSQTPTLPPLSSSPTLIECTSGE